MDSKGPTGPTGTHKTPTPPSPTKKPSNSHSSSTAERSIPVSNSARPDTTSLHDRSTATSSDPGSLSSVSKGSHTRKAHTTNEWAARDILTKQQLLAAVLPDLEKICEGKSVNRNDFAVIYIDEHGKETTLFPAAEAQPAEQAMLDVLKNQLQRFLDPRFDSENNKNAIQERLDQVNTSLQENSLSTQPLEFYLDRLPTELPAIPDFTTPSGSTSTPANGVEARDSQSSQTTDISHTEDQSSHSSPGTPSVTVRTKPSTANAHSNATVSHSQPQHVESDSYTPTLTKKEEQFRRTQDELQNYQQQLTESQQRNIAIQQQLKKTQTENEQNTKFSEHFKQEHRNMGNDISKLKKKIQLKDKQLLQTQQQLKAAASKIAATKENLKRKEQQTKKLNTQLETQTSAAAKQATEHQEQLTQTTQELKNKEQELKKLEQEIFRHKDEQRKATTNNLQTLKSITEKNAGLLNENVKELKTSNATIKTLEKELNLQKQQNADLQLQHQEYQNIQKADGERKKHSRALKKAEQDLKDANEKIDSLKIQQKTITKELEKLQSQNIALTQQASEKGEELSHLQKEINSIQEHSKQLEQERNETITRQEEYIKEDENNKEKLYRQIEQQDKELRVLRQETNEETTSASHEQELDNIIRQERKTLEKEREIHQSRLKEFKKEVQDMEQELEEKAKGVMEIKQLKLEVHTLNEKLKNSEEKHQVELKTIPENFAYEAAEGWIKVKKQHEDKIEELTSEVNELKQKLLTLNSLLLAQNDGSNSTGSPEQDARSEDNDTTSSGYSSNSNDEL